MNKLNSFSKLSYDLVSAINIAKQNKITSTVPCSCVFNEEDYWRYAYKFKKNYYIILKKVILF